MAFVRALRRCGGKVPDVFVQFGVEQQFRFISHPGVMAIAQLMEMRTITRMRANFTQENVEGIKQFDPDLARKAQIAYDHKLPVNFQTLETIDVTLPRLLEEKEQLEAARKAVAEIPAGGDYRIPAGVDISAARPAPNQTDLQGTTAEAVELSGFKLPEVMKQLPK
eukprot:TRINITY_DN117_c0_g1_i1.p1 TRINITY_DN117_c0_g1~~TRINITY_DN117_c0_g1_i1.p1  ORF type:complete len:192 (+),score=33.14 TRINITY_DN117_c0_g1_i1:80-577(+)